MKDVRTSGIVVPHPAAIPALMEEPRRRRLTRAGPLGMSGAQVGRQFFARGAIARELVLRASVLQR
eukprot:3761986-Alexandrium_andersonii.AAC.1